VVERDWQRIFEDTYQGPPSTVERRIWSDVLGEEYPAGLDPYSFVTRTELARFATELRLMPGQALVDVGCGRGGPGLWVTAATMARLTGIDIAENALSAARDRADAMGVEADFRVGSFESTGLESDVADAVMSVDALLFAPDKEAAVRELRRILRTGGRLVLTSWDYHSQPVGRPPQVDDHRPLLEAAGFSVEAYVDSDPGLKRLRQIDAALREAVGELAAEAGISVDEMRAAVEESGATIDTMIRRVLVVSTAA
jgi:SAM-dependent methyltransferase